MRRLRVPAILLACDFGCIKTATVIIGYGADLTLLDNAGRSALTHAKLRAAEDGLESSVAKDATALVALLEAHGAP